MRRLTAITLLLLLGLVPTQALACSPAPPMTVEELLAMPPEWGELRGVYERTYFAGTPNLIVRDSRTVSVVTRYWGEARELGPEMHGDSSIFYATTCGNQSGSVGDRHFEHSRWRSDTQRYAQGRIGSMSPTDVALLTDRFGPPVALSIGTGTRVAAYIALWRDPALALVVFGALFFAAVRFLRRHRRGIEGGGLGAGD